MLAAFPYECSCGHCFIVGIDDEARVGGWMRVMHDVAAKLGMNVVDGADEPTFSCPGCGASHARTPSRPAGFAGLPLAFQTEAP